MNTGMKTTPSSSGRADDLLVVEEVAQIVRRPLGTLRQWRHRGVGPRSFRLEGRVVYRRGDVDAYVAAQERATSTGGSAA